MKQRFGYPSQFDIFYEYARPLHVHRDDREFVAPIDWGQIEKDRQELIDNAYQYVLKGIQEHNYGFDKWDVISKALGYLLPVIIKILFVLVGGSVGIFALDYWNVINLGLF